ncbi:MAG: hypothetical protein AMR96_04985 [Candidatus Adiutrix intracellularis]|jgi:hypothetical protein|nr:MAG: hypothetical protein AMR96_04985 [Candidatus Adiutrix intracellularis]
MSLYIILFLILVAGLIFLSINWRKPIALTEEFIEPTGPSESTDPAEILFSESNETERLNKLAWEKRKQKIAAIL